MVPPHTHDWRLYIKPHELGFLLQACARPCTRPCARPCTRAHGARACTMHAHVLPRAHCCTRAACALHPAYPAHDLARSARISPTPRTRPPPWCRRTASCATRGTSAASCPLSTRASCCAPRPYRTLRRGGALGCRRRRSPTLSRPPRSRSTTWAGPSRVSWRAVVRSLRPRSTRRGR